MAQYEISLYLAGEFKKQQMDDCFQADPEWCLEKGDKNSGGRIVDASLCNFILKEGSVDDYLSPVFDECFEKLNMLICGVMKLRTLTSFESRLILVVRTDNRNPMPCFDLNHAIIELLFKSKTEFVLSPYHYEDLQDRD
ncbi:MAG: hypothetical protein WCH86_01940 [Kiritimatiellales bacterium]